MSRFSAFDDIDAIIAAIENPESERPERVEVPQYVQYGRWEGRHCPQYKSGSVILPDEPCPSNFVAVDFETATTFGYACQLGIVEVMDGKIVLEKEYLFQPPDNKYDWACTNTHHLSAASTANAETFAQYWPEIRTILEGKTIVAHNASFDIRVLNVNIAYYNLGAIAIGDVICTFHELGCADLYSACSLFGIELPRHHDALCDARACAELLLAYSKRPGGVIFIPKVKEKRGSSKISKEHRKPAEDASADSPLAGKRFVLTGEFERWPERDELATILSDMGASVSSGVSGKTDYLVTGFAPGPSKIAKAKEFQDAGKNILIISESDIIELIDKASCK